MLNEKQIAHIDGAAKQRNCTAHLTMHNLNNLHHEIITRKEQ